MGFTIMIDRFITSPVHNLFTLAGRVALAALFVPAGIAKITGYAGTAAYMASKGMPAIDVLLPLTIVVELGGGLLILLGLWTRLGALALAGFVAIATLIFHAFWAVPAEQVMVQTLFFWKNFAITGTLLALVANGPGGWSIDARRA